MGAIQRQGSVAGRAEDSGCPPCSRIPARQSPCMSGRSSGSRTATRCPDPIDRCRSGRTLRNSRSAATSDTTRRATSSFVEALVRCELDRVEVVNGRFEADRRAGNVLDDRRAWTGIRQQVVRRRRARPVRARPRRADTTARPRARGRCRDGRSGRRRRARRGTRIPPRRPTRCSNSASRSDRCRPRRRRAA